MVKARPLPILVDAVQFTGDVGLPEIVALDMEVRRAEHGHNDVLVCPPTDGFDEVIVDPTDWVVTWDDGSQLIYTDANFQAFFEIVESTEG